MKQAPGGPTLGSEFPADDSDAADRHEFADRPTKSSCPHLTTGIFFLTFASAGINFAALGEFAQRLDRWRDAADMSK